MNFLSMEVSFGWPNTAAGMNPPTTSTSSPTKERTRYLKSSH